MGDAENAAPPSKKRVAGKELSRDNPGLDDDATEEETGTFQRASDEVLATRRMVKVRRHQPSSTPSANPFAGICLVPPAESSAKTTGTPVSPQSDGEKAVSGGVDSAATLGNTDADKETEKGTAINEANGANENGEKNGTDGPSDDAVASKEENEPTKAEADNAEEAENDAKEDKDHESPPVATVPLRSFQQLSSSQNAFTGLAGTGFSSSSFSFGSIPKEGSTFVGAFGLKTDSTSFPSFGFGSSNNGSSSLQLFGSTVASDASKTEGSTVPSMHEVPVETGEENEKAVFTADAVLFEYLDGGWKERGKGEVKVNVSTTGVEKARLVMRARGNYRLILNANLYPDMKLTNMDKKGITFACVNSASSEGKDKLTTCALKFKDGLVVDDFCGAVTAHNRRKADVLKTPENSPKACDD